MVISKINLICDNVNYLSPMTVVLYAVDLLALSRCMNMFRKGP